MLDRRWLAALALLGSWALWEGHSQLTLVAALGLSLAAAIGLTRRYSLVGVSYRRSLARERAQVGDEVELTIEISNLKLMPLALLELEDQLPRHLSVSGAAVRVGRGALLPCLYVVRSMLPYERVVRRLRVHCDRRGLHQFGPASWHAGDFLAAPARHTGTSDTQALLILPKIFPLRCDGLAWNQIIGPNALRRRELSDPMRTIGARDYVAGDPLRLVNWRASARRGSLMVRQLEASSAPTLQIALHFSVHAPSGDRFEPDELEFAISVAASLAAYGAMRGWRLGLRGNALSAGAPLEIPAGNAPAQLPRILEALARAHARTDVSLAELLLRRREGSTLLIADHVDEPARRALDQLQRQNQNLIVVHTAANGCGTELGRIKVHRIPYEPGWRQRDALVLTP